MTRRARAGVDIGGTFTDIVTVRDGELATHKTPSTPSAPAEAVRTGLDLAVAAGDIETEALDVLGHGTTVATNAVLEGEWAQTALITTAGFRDVLEIGRQARPDIYDHDASKPTQVIPRNRRYEVSERLDERGNTLTSLDEAAIRDVADEIDEATESIAISLLYAFENPSHERRVEAILDEELEVAISCSTDVLPEIREYERTLATALNAGLRPLIDSYLGRLAEDLAAQNPTADLRVMGSNGGTMTASAARRQPIQTLLSGPAAGVRGAAHVASEAGFDDLLTLDMGGTSCDVSVVRDGEPTISTEVEVGDYPVSVPMVDVHTVGSGGGSIAWIDDGGALRVGPQSAGAHPGPVCYNRGGDQPTTTDAQVLLGRIDPSVVLEDPADTEKVAAAMQETVATALDKSPTSAAEDVLQVANATMERALRVVSVERGHDPRDLTLVAFGGAGPLHAPALAEALDVPRVIVPPTAGVLSALGLLVSDLVRDASRSMVRSVASLDANAVESVFTELETEVNSTLQDAAIPPDRQVLERQVDLRYEGQSFDLGVSIADPCDPGALRAAVDRFHEQHRERYGHADPDEPVELVTVRLRGRGLVDPPPLEADETSRPVADAVRTERDVTVDGDVYETAVYDRSRLSVGAHIDGPAIIEGAQSTAFVRPGQSATVDDVGNLIVEVSP